MDTLTNELTFCKTYPADTITMLATAGGGASLLYLDSLDNMAYISFASFTTVDVEDLTKTKKKLK